MADVLVRITGLPADQISALQELPGQAEELVEQARTLLEGIRSGTDDGNPVGAMFSALSSLADDVERLPAVEDLLGGARELVEGLPSAVVADLGAVGEAVETVLGGLAPIREAVASGGVEAALQAAADRVRTLGDQVVGGRDRAGPVLGELGEFLRLFRGMLDWDVRAPDPREVVDLLARALVGIPGDVFDGAIAALDAALAPVEALVPDGPDLTLWAEAPDRMASSWADLRVRVQEPGPIAWAEIEASLARLRADLLAAGAARDRLTSATLSAMAGLRLPGLDGVVEALADLPRIQATRLGPIVEGLRLQLERIAAELESFAPTPDELRVAVREFVDTLVDIVEATPLGRLRAMLVSLQERFLRAVESLPFRDLARQAERALTELSAVIDVVDPDLVRAPIRDFFDGLEGRVDDVSGAQVQGGVRQLWAQVEDVVRQVADVVEQIRSTVDDVVGPLASFGEETGAGLEAVLQQAATIRAALEGVDLAPAGQLVVDRLHEVRDAVEALPLEDLPSAALAPLREGARAIREIDVTAEVSGPLDEILSTLDPSALVGEVNVSLGGLVDALASVDPAALASRLDEPIDTLLELLGEFDPDRFRASIQQALEPVVDALDALDVADLVAPLTQLYAELRARVDSFLDPEAIFAPLEELFQPVIDLIDALAPTRLADLLGPHAESAGSGVSGVASPPPSLTEASGALRDALAAGPESDDELFGFRPGDLLVPLIDLHRRLMAAFDALADDVLEPAAEMLRDAFVGAFEALRPRAVELRIDRGLAAAVAPFDLAAVSARLEAPVMAYQVAVAAIGSAARGDLSVADRAVAVRVTTSLPDLDPLRLLPAAEQSERLRAAAAGARARVELGTLRARCDGAAAGLDALFLPFMRDPDLGASAVRDELRRLDPSPLRDEINELFDRVGARIVVLGEALMAGIDELGRAIEDFVLPLTPAHLLGLASRLHAGVKQEILTLGPAAFRDEVQALFDVIKRQVSVLDPSGLVEEFGGFKRHLIETLRGLADGLVPDREPFDELQAQLAGLRPSEILSPLADRLRGLTEVVANLDPAALLTPVVDAFARIRAQLPDLIHDIEVALDEVLAALEGGGEGVGAEISVGASASVG